MSAFNCFLTPDAAHLFTDGASYDGTTIKIAGVGSKVIYLPQYSAAVTSTGYHWVQMFLDIALKENIFEDFDHLVVSV